jgi:opacity protein-like surface antigen
MEKRMKKLLIAATVAGLVGTVNAQSAFEGFYGQIGVGYESVDGGFSNGTMKSGTASGRAYTFSSSNGNSFIGNVGIGAYFPVTKTFLLGAGAEYSPFAGSSTNATFKIPTLSFTSTSSWKKKDSYNIFLSPAIAVDKDKLAYAKIGFTGMSTQQTDSDGTKTNENYTGYSLGLGYKQMVSGSIYAFGEVNYATYGSKNMGSDLSGSAKPSSMNALVGVGYKL